MHLNNKDLSETAKVIHYTSTVRPEMYTAEILHLTKLVILLKIERSVLRKGHGPRITEEGQKFKSNKKIYQTKKHWKWR